MRNGDGDRTIAYIETKPSALDTTKLREKSSGEYQLACSNNINNSCIQ